MTSEVCGISAAMSSRENENDSRKLEREGSLTYLNERHEADVNYAIKANRWFMKILGVWPMSYDTNNSTERCIARILTACSIFFLLFVLVTGSLDVCMKEQELVIRIKMMGILSFCIMSGIKYLSVLIKRREIGQCIRDIVKNWARFYDKEEREIMYSYALYGRYGVTICATFMYGGGVLFYIIMPLMAAPVAIPHTNLTIKMLPGPAYLIFVDVDRSPTHEIIYATHLGLCFVMHTTSVIGCSLALVFVVHACSQLEIVVSWLDRLLDCDDKEHFFREYSLEKRLGIIVDQHVRTLDFISCTEIILREICLVDVLGSTLNICLLGFDLLMEWEPSGPIALLTYASLIISFLFNIFLFSYVGEMLTEECQKVGEKTYMIEWYRLPSKTAVSLTLTIATAGNPVTITAGGLGNLSLMTFTTVLKTSLGYLNILRTLTA